VLGHPPAGDWMQPNTAGWNMEGYRYILQLGAGLSSPPSLAGLTEHVARSG